MTYKNSNTKFSKRHPNCFELCILVVCICFVFSASDFVFAEAPSEIVEAANSVVAPVAAEPDSIVKEACAKIYEGDFASARKLLGESNSKCAESAEISRLRDIVSEYEAIEQRRRSAREAAYAEKLAELAQHQKSFDSRRFDAGRADTDSNDVNDVNDIRKLFSIIAGVREFADERQKKELLSRPFVEQVFQKAKTRAAEFESKGKWLDAYINCYSWLKVIEPNNKEYSDYAEQLIDKANIVASFQDSPCETSKERYEEVKKRMFVRAVDALKHHYVSAIIDYRQMAVKAIRRCRLLAEVINRAPGLVARDPNEPWDMKYVVWSAGLTEVLDEANASPTGVSKDKFINIFEKVLELNAATVELPSGVLIVHFAEASLSVLDPYTVMIWPRQVQDFEKVMTNEFTGIGIEISKQKGLLTVASLLPDTPAYNSGLDAGDVIEAVDGVPTKDMSLGCAVKNITGPAGTDVKLTIRRSGQEQTSDITITRAKITVPTIRGWQRTEAGKWLYIIDERNKIGYVRVTSFSAETASDLEEVLVQLEGEGLKGLILDLRANSGGLLNSAVEVTDKFVKEGLIVRTRPRFWVSSTYEWAHKNGTHPDYPLVVLINRSSASASEIVAGALADKAHNRAILVGERSHGKGSVQGITSYPDGGAQLKYTMAYYHLPSGQRVESREAMKKQDRNDWGVGPNIKVKLRNDELKKRFDVQRDNDVLVKADHDNGTAPLKKRTTEETLAADPQLAVGVLVIKSKLVEAESVKCLK